MKVAVLALCVVLPSICLCTPLPDYSVAAGSSSGSSVNTSGPTGPISANSNSSSNVNVGTPPAVPPTTVAPATPDVVTPPPTQTPPCTQTPPTPTGTQPPAPTTVDVNSSSDSNVSVNQQGGNGPSTSVSANSQSSASVSISGNPCGKPDVDGFNNYSVLVKNQGDIEKFTAGNWMVWKSSSSSTKIETQEPVCAPRYLDQSCQASQYKITVKSDTEIFYEVWGTNGQTVVYIKQQLSITSQKFHIYTSQVVSISEVASGSQEVIAVQNEQVIKQYFDNGQFAILDTDYKTYMICTTSGQNSVTFVSLSQEVYASSDLRLQVSQKVDQVLKVNNLSSVKFVEVTNKFGVDITQYQWDKCSQGGSPGGSPGSSPNGGNTSINAGSNSSTDVKVNQNNNNGSPDTSIKAGTDASSNVDVKQNNSQGSPDTSIKAGSDASSNVDVKQKNSQGSPDTSIKAGTDASSNVDVKQNGGSPGGDTSVKAGSDSSANVDVTSKGGNNGNNQGGSCSGSSGKPTQQGFTNYSVLKISFEEFKKQIGKTTWFVAKYTQMQQEIKSDVTVCCDRCVSPNCKAVKFQYVEDDGCFVMKEWGYDGVNLIYIQEKITAVTQDFVIIKSEVVNVMKATKDTDVAVKVENSEQVKSYLNSEYAVLGTDYKNFFIGQTSCDQGSITFVAFIQEIYECEEKQQQYCEQISKILKESGIDESKLQKLTQKFDVDTNKYNKVKCETDSKGGKTTTTTETEHEGGAGKTKTETSVTNQPSGQPSGTTVDANTSSNTNVNVDASKGPSPGTSVNANSQSDANVNVQTGQPPSPGTSGGTNINANTNSSTDVTVNNNNNGTPPCTGTPDSVTPPPAATPPAATPTPTGTPSPATPSSINVNSNSGANASVDTTGGNTSVNTNSASDASVNVNNGAP